MRIKASRLISLVGLVIWFSFLATNQTLAASTIMRVSPNSGEHDSQFTVNLEIDGQGDIFNAAKAEVIIPEELKIKDLVLGDCGFSFLSTPSIVNPSFEGVILGSSSGKCTVYSMEVIPVGDGEASVLLENAAVQRYGDAANVLSTVEVGSYSLTAVTDSDLVAGIDQIEDPQSGLYTVVLRTYSDNGPEASAQVNIKNVDSGEALNGTTDQTGNVQFANIQSGIYTIEVEKDGVQFVDNILNVSGDNHILSLGIKLRLKPVEQEQTPVTTLLENKVLVAVIAGLTLVVVLLLGIILRAKIRAK